MQRGGRLRPPRLAFSELASGRYVQIRCRRSRVFGPALAAHCGASWCRVPHLLSLLGWDFEHDRAWIGIAWNQQKDDHLLRYPGMSPVVRMSLLDGSHR